MRRQDIQLLACARQGDSIARCEVGRRYLLGVDGFPLHPDIGLEYLTHPSLTTSELAAKTIEGALPLHELVRRNLMPALMMAARSGSTSAQLKLGAWRILSSRDADAASWFELAATSGSASARTALRVLEKSDGNVGAAVIGALAGEPGIDASRSVVQAMTSALQSKDAARIARMLECALIVPSRHMSELADAFCAALCHVRYDEKFPLLLDNKKTGAFLEDCIRRGNAVAALLLGRALSGFDTPDLPASLLTNGKNMRRGAALLLRAADAGCNEAWMLLYRIHSDNRASVANPQMARLFLEKAAIAGDVCAQRRLGTLILRSSTSLQESEQGIHWLHLAAHCHDVLAEQLLGSLILPVAGVEAKATSAIDAIRLVDPWLACRLRTARDFGLTKLEAMSVDIVAGQRPWGLVVGQNHSIAQAKLAEPRAIPALQPQVFESLRRTVAFFEQSKRDGAPIEGDRRRRTHRLRYCLERAGLHESLFFAEASSTALNSLRQGPKWAFHARKLLRAALTV